jgi:hypothetical protein
MGRITIDIEASGPVLGAALEHEKAEPVIGCAVLMALSALAEGGGWPTAVLDSMSAFMSSMKDYIGAERLM